MSNIFQPSILPNNIHLLIETFIRFYNVSCLNVLNALDIIRIVREIESSGTNKKDCLSLNLNQFRMTCKIIAMKSI